MIALIGLRLIGAVGGAWVDLALLVVGACVCLGHRRAAAREFGGLRDQIQRLQIAMSGAGIGAWEFDVVTSELFWDAILFDLYGRDPDSDLPSYELWRESVHPDDVDRVESLFERALTGEADFHTSFRITQPDGRRRHLSASATVLRDEHGAPVRVIGTNCDITLRKRTEFRLQQNERVLAHAGGLARIGGWELDLRTKELHWSDALYQIHEVPDDFVPTVESAIQFYAPEARPAIGAAVEHGIETGESWDLELPLITAKGRRIWVRAMGEPRSEDGKVVMLTGGFQDITEQKEFQIELESARFAAEAASVSKSEFLANMSHEIRTPMTAILGYAELLALEELSDDVRREHAQTIQRNGEFLLSIINDLLDLSKIEAGKMTLEQQATSPLGLIDEVFSLMRIRALGKGLEIQTDIEDRLPRYVRTDPLRLRQVLVNIIGNSIKFTETGGVTLHLGFDAERGCLVIEVRDSGIGMSAEQLDIAFDAFSQADSSVTRRFGGTGLGLSISRSLVGLLGGEIGIESTVGEGTTVRVLLPMGEESPELVGREALERELSQASAEQARVAEADPSPLDGVRILLVEDGRDNQRLISFMLRKVGAVVDIADNGRVALERVADADEAESFDLILMDLQMPEMDGLTATRTLRRGGFDRPIIALTAHAMAGDRDQCLREGCSDFTTKPVNRKKLVELCRTWSGRTRPS